ncbi:MAG: hypothetical protein ACI3ZA_07580 [Alloprevotella sp.]
MKKTLLSLACVLLGGTMAYAQEAAEVGHVYQGVTYNNCSPNGKWLVANQETSVYIYDVATGKNYDFADETYTKVYFAGYGHSVTDNGMVCGMAQESAESNAAYFKDGAWVVLPQLSGKLTGFNSANACTPDGSVICGSLGSEGADMSTSDRLMLYPVVWTLNADGVYVCQELPHPTKDFTGRVPQYVTAMDISADGNTIVGQVVDYSGFYIVPILYTRNAEGAWSYQLLAEDQVYDKEKAANLPEWVEQPVQPRAEDYMSADDVDDYNDAVEAYNEAYQRCVAGDLDWSELPEYPEKGFYISDQEQAAAYAAAVEQYNEENAAWYAAFEAFDEALTEATTGKNFEFNSIHITPNGKYILTDLKEPDPDPDPMAWFPESIYTNCVFDLTKVDTPMLTTSSNMLSTGILDNGFFVVAAPKSDYARSSYVATPGSNHLTPIIDWCKASGNAAAGDYINSEMRFEAINYVWNEDNEMYDEVTVGDSLITGTGIFSADGKTFVTWLQNPSTFEYVTYTVSLENSVLNGIQSVKHSATEQNVLRREYYNVQGQRIAAPIQGVYFEKIITADGAVTKKHLK